MVLGAYGSVIVFQVGQTLRSAPRHLRLVDRFRRLLRYRAIGGILLRESLLVGVLDDIICRSSDGRAGGSGDVGVEAGRCGMVFDFHPSRNCPFEPLSGHRAPPFCLRPLFGRLGRSTIKIRCASFHVDRSHPRILPSVLTAALHRREKKRIWDSSHRDGPFVFSEHRQRNDEGSVRFLRGNRYRFR